MGRLVTTAAVITTLCLAACASTPPEKTWEEIRAERVGDFMLHLNNASTSERWREGMIEVGQKSEEDRVFVIKECRQAYDESLNRGGVGTGILRSPGRRRVMQIATALGDKPDTRGILHKGVEDDADVSLAAAAGLASWGDEAAIPRLFKAILSLPAGDEGRKRGLQAVRSSAKPAMRPVYLNALKDGDIRVLHPALLATFPSDREAKLKELRKVVETHANPYARRFAMRILIEEKDEGVIPLARKALEGKDRVLRPTALQALGSVGGNAAAKEIEAVLRTDPKDSRAVVRGLYQVGTTEALDRAIDVLGARDLKPKTRAAVAREFLAQLKTEDAPGPYREAEAVESALRSLRATLDEGIALLSIASVDAIGRIGDRDADVAPLLTLLEDPSPKVAPVVVEALGRLGGEYAAAKLVELVANDPDLRLDAARALGTYTSTRDVPVAELIDMLEGDDQDQRKAALKALKGLRKSTDAMGYNPADDEQDRATAVERWRGWWTSRRG